MAAGRARSQRRNTNVVPRGANAATAEGDFAWFQHWSEGFDVALENASDRTAMVAVQGPNAPALVGELFPAALALPR